MDKKYKLLFLAAAVAGVVVCIAAALEFRTAHGQLLFRPDPKDFIVSYQTESGIYLEAYFADSSQPEKPVSPADTPAPEYLVNINTATEYELAALLPGIGPKKAESIVTYRRMTGGFRSVEELIEVEGISASLLEKIRPYCVVDDQSQ